MNWVTAELPSLSQRSLSPSYNRGASEGSWWIPGPGGTSCWPVTCRGQVGEVPVRAQDPALRCGLTEKEEARQEGKQGPTCSFPGHPEGSWQGTLSRRCRGSQWAEVAGGKHPHEGFNCWKHGKSSSLVTWSVCLSLQGPVIPNGEKMDFGHTWNWVGIVALFYTGCVSFDDVTFASLSFLIYRVEGRAHRGKGPVRCARKAPAEKHMWCVVGAHKRLGTRAQPWLCSPFPHLGVQLPSPALQSPEVQTPLLILLGEWWSWWGSCKDEGWNTLYASVFCLFIHVVFDSCLCVLNFACLSLLYTQSWQDWQGPNHRVKSLVRTWHGMLM